MIPGLGRSPGEGNGNPFQYSCLKNPMDREEPGRLQSMESQRVKQAYTSHLKAEKIYFRLWVRGDSLIVQLVNNPPTMQEMLIQFLGRQDPLEKG